MITHGGADGEPDRRAGALADRRHRRREQPVASHGEADPADADELDQDDRGQAADRRDVDQRAGPAGARPRRTPTTAASPR